jgi:hypothetical protein
MGKSADVAEGAANAPLPQLFGRRAIHAQSCRDRILLNRDANTALDGPGLH